MAELFTERLILKGITPAIIHEQYNSRSKEEIMQFFGFDEQGYEHFRNMHEQGMESYRISMFFFLLIRKEDQQPIGECGFHTWNRNHSRAELFYLLRKDEYKQQGYMKEALQVVLPYGFNELKLHRIEALVDKNNTPSVKLLQHFNFTKEGTMREDYLVNGKYEDSDCYSLLPHEFHAEQFNNISR